MHFSVTALIASITIGMVLFFTAEHAQATGFNSAAVSILTKKLEGSNIFLGLSAVSSSTTEVENAVENDVHVPLISNANMSIDSHAFQAVQDQVKEMQLRLDEATSTPQGQYVLIDPPTTETKDQELIHKHQWDIHSNEDVLSVLKRWTKNAGWNLEFDTSIPITVIEMQANYEGTIESAVQSLFKTLPNNFPVKVSVYTEEKLMVIKTIEPESNGSGWSVGEPNLWSFKSDQKLHALLTKWTAKSGWSLIWDNDADDQDIGAEASYRKEFTVAMASLCRMINEGSTLAISMNVEAKELRVSKNKKAMHQTKNQIVKKG
jgi:hypothetical protein